MNAADEATRAFATKAFTERVVEWLWSFRECTTAPEVPMMAGYATACVHRAERDAEMRDAAMLLMMCLKNERLNPETRAAWERLWRAAQ